MINTYTTKEALAILQDVIQNDKTHQYYKRTVELAKLYRQLITLEDIDQLMRQFVRREDSIMFEQRKLITKHITKSVCENLMSVFYKVTRSNSIQLIKKNESKEKLQELNDVTNAFYGDESVKEYLEDKIVDMEHIDPNSWIFVEFKPTDGQQRAEPYPFEVWSKEAIYYEKINNVLQYIVVKFDIEVSFQKKQVLTTEVLPRYTIYTKDQAISLTQTKDDRLTLIKDGETQQLDGNDYIRLKRKNYLITIPLPYNLESVPAICVGYKLDKITDGQTYVNPFDAALPYLEKTIKSVSELDLTQSLHAFPQKVQAVTRCENTTCNGGYLPDGECCRSCEGTGMQIIKTTQDAITLPMPTSKEEQLDIGNIIQYISPSTDIIRWMDEYIEKLTAKCRSTVFSADIYSRSEIAQTATSKVIDLQAVYDTLYPFAVKYAKTWKFITIKCAEITELTKGLTVTYHVNKDFKLKSLEDLIAELKMLNESGASSTLIHEVQKDIAEVIYQDRPLELKRYVLKESFYPFSGKSKEAVASIISSLPIDHPKRVLWTFYGVIFDEIEEQYPDFYEMPREKQRIIIDKKIEVFKSTLPEQKLNLNA